MSYQEHKQAADQISARCAVITLSDTRTEADDRSGRQIRELLTEAGQVVVAYRIIPDDPQQLASLCDQFLHDDGIDTILTNGGTGISRRDRTIEAIEKLIDQPLPGFGELFRMLSWQEIGSGAMLSRAVGGIAAGKLIFAMPGSTAAVELAMSKLIVPELRHLLRELRK
ncbi:MAG TPA: MogA/MoaB family molybdenum cofactor biosynthesis protein [Humisphaera sp.]|jgi:molybdenum cofactor biosynthesis protein B|nr:MogA/MoaB family molybdenum cofactor biosynthesis protein [Humisphaera sp.]